MSTIDSGTIIGALSGLSAGDLAKVKAASEYLLQNGQIPDRCEPDHLLYRAAAHLLESRISFDTFRSTRAYSRWRRHTPTVFTFIDRHFPSVTKDVAKLALMRWLLGMLMEDLQAKGLPVTMGILTNNLGRLPAVFEQCFPDYIQCGLAMMVFQMATRAKAAM